MTKLITSQANIRYHSGFSGSTGMLIIEGSRSTLIVDGRYTDQAREEVINGIKVVQTPTGSSLADIAIDILKRAKTTKIGYEDDKLDVATFNKLRKAMPKSAFSSISNDLRNSRMAKNRHEIELISKAALIADLTYDCILHIIRPGLTELEISAHIDYLMKTFKAESAAFETLVSSGKLSCKPHGKPTDKVINKGDLVIIDFGARYKGYNSDITRMISVGEPSKKQRDIFNAVLDAHDAAIAKVKTGVKAEAVDAAARKVLERNKLEKFFTHGTGHGIGLQVHEGPRVALKSIDTLKEGMVITIEPGVYIPGLGGFRLEDDVLVTKTGSKLLSNSSRELKVIS